MGVLVPHHRLELSRAQEQTVRVAGQFAEFELLVERLRRIIHAVEDDRYECERVTRLITVAQGLGQQESAEALPLVLDRHPKPCKDGDRQHPPRQLLRLVRWQVPKIGLAACQGVVPSDLISLVQKDTGRGEVLDLVLKGILGKPLIDLGHPTPELLPRVDAGQWLQPEAGRERDAAHALPRISSPSFRWASVSTGGSFRAAQKASCSSGDMTIVWPRAASTSRRAWATVTVRT